MAAETIDRAASVPVHRADRADPVGQLEATLERQPELRGGARPLPGQARVVVIGGGVGGASIAYHLAKAGWTDIVLVERADIASGTTFHSAGNVGQLRSSLLQTRMMLADGVSLYARLREETGVDPSWHGVGSLRLASSAERLEELRRQAGLARSAGLDLEIIGPAEAKSRFPLIATEGLLAAGHIATDGWIDPAGLTLAFATGARQAGAAIATRTRVTGIRLSGDRVAAVQTDRGEILAECVVNAAGMFAAEIGRLVGVNVPVVAMEHQYLITEPMAGVDAGWPVVRDPDNLVYFRPETGGLQVGGFERHPVPWGLDGIPADFNARLLPPDWPRFEEIMPGAIRRLPAVADLGIAHVVNGPDAFTPDGEFILGETEVGGFWVAAGFCSHGIALAAAVGQQMARWIVDGEPGFDLSGMDVRRFGPQHRSRAYTLARTIEVCAGYFTLHAPGEERQAGRPLRVSPAYARLRDLGAVFGEKAGWERANWFASNEVEGDETLRPRGLPGRHWSPAIGAEALATRRSAGLFDLSSFTKIEVGGRGATAFLQRLCANDLDRPVGSVTYTQLLNRRGGVECDLTVTRLADDRYLVVTGAGAGRHDLAWIERQAPRDGSVQIRDVTSSRACYGLWGPRARDVLQEVAEEDIRNEAFPYLSGRELVVGHVPVLALRVTNVGELGWELYAPAEYGLALWDTIWEAGRRHGLVAAGYRAAEALRLEKGYRAWPADVSPEVTPGEAGLGRFVRLDKAAAFVGREAILLARGRGETRRWCCLLIDDPGSLATGDEPVRIDGEIVGHVTSGGYGFSLGRSIAYAYLRATRSAVGTKAEVEISGEWVPGAVARAPLYDPSGDRIRS